MSDTEENQVKLLKDSNFHQQNLPSWNPVILISTIYPLFGSFGIVFILIGIGLLLSSISVNEFRYDYTHCKEYDKLNNNYSNRICSGILNSNYTNNYQSCLCNIKFRLDKQFSGQVYFYYSLQNFFQNHRRYFSSKDDKQLMGKSIQSASDYCKPFDKLSNGSFVQNYAPCGLIANSLFNDTFQLSFINSTNSIPVSMKKKGIAWKVDVDLLYGTPTDWTNTLKPTNWKYSAEERSNSSYKGDEDLLVWMRTAPLSTFKKLSGIIKHESPFQNGLPAGNYELLINYAYPVSIFGGTKMVFLTTTSAMGGKNNNLGIMYITLGTIHELIALVFLVFTLFRQKKKTSFSDTPLIMSPLTPESYGLKEIPFQREDNPKMR